MTGRGARYGRAALALAVLAAGGCGGMTSGGRKTNQLAAMRDTAGALIQMRRSGCPPERCPAYSVSIFIDGSVSYDGRENVGVVGKRYAKLAGERVSELMSAIDAMDFLDIPERCCLCPAAPGSQVVIVDYRPGSSQKTVVHEQGCSSAPCRHDRAGTGDRPGERRRALDRAGRGHCGGRSRHGAAMNAARL